VQNLFYRIRGLPGVHGYDRLHNIHLGLVGKIMESLRKTLSLANVAAHASRWQIAYLAYAQVHARFSGLRIFTSIDTKRNFDDNNSFMVLLPLLFPPFLFAKCAEIDRNVDERGGTEVLMALITFVQLCYPAQAEGTSSTQLDMLQQTVHTYVFVIRAIILNHPTVF
jgi:hypothetical protein